ncbi:hypothetical protein PFMG_01585 [Plasmodium falciparum IGH-CR14]|uniref:Uncharacterized protein n=1 Tax=Plasmodium falciparum IGH-CR14 TaxID=580059 RepID=A0A0L1I8D1_PLAFA|nr:hypothetical protein PFMG_01585 [Plasmodium falciparum IGH-CR14]
MEYLILEEKYKNLLDLKGLTKTYRKMIKNRNKELFESEILMAENINLRNNIQVILIIIYLYISVYIILIIFVISPTLIIILYFYVICYIHHSFKVVNNEKLSLESELNKKKKIINVIKDKYKKNIGRLLEKFNQKDRHIYEFQSFIIDELNNLKEVILRENENMHFDETLMNNKFMNISFHLDIVILKKKYIYIKKIK